ncbi:hypothetical protein [Bradyrhizobium sp.]|uniref:hypothetical protein n=1 Tax=Bradyrhizobium sp. TaxID=376 RepID=UPI0025BF01EE|nr:hypothetical protein [Bradyrhizobium sp.]
MTNLKEVSDVQYSIIAARRLQYDNLLWQTPVMSLIGMSFLFTIAFGNPNPTNRIFASVLALAAALASAHLLSKHRYFELHYAKLLQEIESARGHQTVSERPPRAKRPTGWSAYLIWLGLFFGFATVALITGIRGWVWP